MAWTTGERLRMLALVAKHRPLGEGREEKMKAIAGELGVTETELAAVVAEYYDVEGLEEMQASGLDDEELEEAQPSPPRTRQRARRR